MVKTNFLDALESGNKSAQLKREILRRYMKNGGESIADLSRELGLSVPTLTKIVGTLIEEDFVCDLGKQVAAGGRRPSIYGLNPSAGYFMGVDIKRDVVVIGIINFRGDMVVQRQYPFTIENTRTSFDRLCELINSFIATARIRREKLFATGINIPGRINPETGYSYSYFFFDEKPVTAVLEERLGCRVYIENDSRAMAYGEYVYGVGNSEQNMIFLNLSWGFGIGMILGGELHYGKSGFSGEYGHFPFFDNEIICSCGKRGCLETEVSGSAAHRLFMDNLKQGKISMLSPIYERGETISVRDILDAVDSEDMLAIEVMEQIGSSLGRAIAGLINMFNPEVIVLGGTLCSATDYLLPPIKSAINKYALNFVSKDTAIKVSKLGESAGLIGICAITRNRTLGL
ncbi:MAG: ROK family transcriptional regulator [Alistipes sp.]|nr:ROK family transcriptional regulator [Alistipes sp.]